MVKKKKDLPAEERILDAAKKVFLEKGMAGARMQDIANEAGINKALLHYYYRDKEKLFELVFMSESQKFFPKINRIFESDETLEKKFHEFVEEYVNELRLNPYLPWFVLNEINRDPDGFLLKIMTGENRPRPMKFLQQIEKEIKLGNIRKVDPRHILLNLLSMTLFPFIAQPMVSRILGMGNKEFEQLMEERKKTVPAVMMDSIRKKVQ
ncbi:MAG: TetR/AcrR family transcriptional regulator [Chitinophagaceae bacterium]|nr:TetR/AcrR family transcriptional regulator [Chitinophagaceae bacterium]